MQLSERAPDDIAGQMRVGQHLKRRRREHEGEEQETANPDHERENHQEAQEGHDGSYYHLQDTERAKVNAVISKAVAAMRSAPSSGDVEIYGMLVADGLKPAVAARLVEFLPMAYCRLLLKDSGVRFPNTFQRKQANGKISSERLLSSEPVWKAAIAFARDESERGISRGDLLAVAARSAEFQVVNQMLNQGSNLRDIALTPALLMWQEAGPSGE